MAACDRRDCSLLCDARSTLRLRNARHEKVDRYAILGLLRFYCMVSRRDNLNHWCNATNMAALRQVPHRITLCLLLWNRAHQPTVHHEAAVHLPDLRHRSAISLLRIALLPEHVLMNENCHLN